VTKHLFTFVPFVSTENIRQLNHQQRDHTIIAANQLIYAQVYIMLRVETYSEPVSLPLIQQNGEKIELNQAFKTP